MSEITSLRTGEAWLYVCAVRDGCSCRVLGWAMDSTQTTDLVERALQMAHALRGEVAQGLVFHADRGRSSPAISSIRCVRNRGSIDQSMGRTGVFRQCDSRILLVNTCDRVFTTVEYKRTATRPTRPSPRRIEIFSNRSRRHSSIGNQFPVDFENTYHQAATAATKNAA